MKYSAHLNLGSALFIYWLSFGKLSLIFFYWEGGCFFVYFSSCLGKTRLHTETKGLYLAWTCLKSLFGGGGW